MSKNVFRLTESELVKLIKTVISEQVQIVTNHDRSFDYKKDGDKFYFKGKGKYADRYPNWTLATKQSAIDAIRTKVFNMRPSTDLEPIEPIEPDQGSIIPLPTKPSNEPESESPDWGRRPTGVSDKLLNYVAKKEGFIPCVYDDRYASECIRQSLSRNPDWNKCCGKVKQRTNRTTIGYGTTYYPDGSPVMPKDKSIDKETAKKYMRSTLDDMAMKLLKLYPKLNQNQLDALTSLCYNVGFGGCTTKAPGLTSALKKDLNPNTNPKIKSSWLDWELPERRAEEFRIYSTGNYS
jgi:GH24 family phage-related lysozyme (muramidase)